jgi:hypothetical protein
VRPGQRVAELQLQLARELLGSRIRPAFHHLQYPRDEQKVPRPRLDGTGSSEKHIGDRIADVANAKLVKRSRFVEPRNSFHHCPTLALAAV